MKLDRFVMAAMGELFQPGATTFKGIGNEPGWIRRPTKEELDKYFRESEAGPAFDPTVHWCGIFATYLLKKAGVRCHWVRSVGITNDEGASDLETANPPEAQLDLRIGDVLIREPEHHHIIVLEPVSVGAIRCVEGNAGGLGNPLLAMNWGGGKNLTYNSVDRVVKRYRIKEKMSYAGLIRGWRDRIPGKATGT